MYVIIASNAVPENKANWENQDRCHDIRMHISGVNTQGCIMNLYISSHALGIILGVAFKGETLDERVRSDSLFQALSKTCWASKQIIFSR